jgi:hypothetical protein
LKLKDREATEIESEFTSIGTETEIIILVSGHLKAEDGEAR